MINYINKGDITKTNITDIMISAFLGGAGGALGGPGGGSKHLDALSKQLFKRIGHAFKHEIGEALIGELEKAIAYYIKLAGKLEISIMKNILISFIPTLIDEGIDVLNQIFDKYLYE